MNDKELPKEYWAEAVRWCIFLQNRSPTTAVQGMTPEEKWSGTKPSVQFFRVFGCIGHVHLPEALRKKLDKRSIKCVLLGISDESKAYRLVDPLSKKIYISRDVVFNEDDKWNWNQDKEKQKEELIEAGDSDQEVTEDIAQQNETHSNTTDTNEATTHSNATDTNEAETGNAQQQQEDGSNTEDDDSDDSLPQREIKKPAYLNDYYTNYIREAIEEEDEFNLAVITQITDPVSFEEAVKSDKWKKAMDLEIEAIERNNTWELVDLPKGSKRIGVKWVYKTKLNEKGEIEKYKARLVAKGFSQREGVDYREVFAPVARWDTIRTVIAVAALKGWCVYQLDVKSAFLHGELSETVFVDQPQGYQRKGLEGKVYKLKKALYGLKQAPRAWYSKIEAYFKKEKFHKCPSEYTLFVKKDES